MVLGKSQDGFDAVQPRGAAARAAEQVAGEREGAVGHGWGAAGQVHGESGRQEGAARALGSAVLFRDREEAQRRCFPCAAVQPDGYRPKVKLGGPHRQSRARWRRARSARGRLGPRRSRRGDSRELVLRGLKAGDPLTLAPPLRLPTQSPPPPPRSGRIPGRGQHLSSSYSLKHTPGQRRGLTGLGTQVWGRGPRLASVGPTPSVSPLPLGLPSSWDSPPPSPPPSQTRLRPQAPASAGLSARGDPRKGSTAVGVIPPWFSVVISPLSPFVPPRAIVLGSVVRSPDLGFTLCVSVLTAPPRLALARGLPLQHPAPARRRWAVCARRPGTRSAPRPSRSLEGPSRTRCRAQSRGRSSLSQPVLREPSPPTDSPGAGGDPPQADWGRTLRGGGPPASLGVTGVTAGLSFLLGDPSRLPWPRVARRPNGKVTGGEEEGLFCCPHPRCCDRWLRPDPRRTPAFAELKCFPKSR